MDDDMLVDTRTSLDLDPTLLREVLRRRRPFTVAEYHQMGEAGILDEDDRVELIAGEVVKKARIRPPHAGGVNRLNHLFVRSFDGRATISGQNPVRLDNYSEPEPDVVLLKYRADYYATQTPRPSDTLLLVEIGDSTAAFDRRVKLRLYAMAGLPEVWLLNLKRDLLTVHREPTPDGYLVNETYRRGMTLAPMAFPEDAFDVAELLG